MNVIPLLIVLFLCSMTAQGRLIASHGSSKRARTHSNRELIDQTDDAQMFISPEDFEKATKMFELESKFEKLVRTLYDVLSEGEIQLPMEDFERAMDSYNERDAKLYSKFIGELFISMFKGSSSIVQQPAKITNDVKVLFRAHEVTALLENRFITSLCNHTRDGSRDFHRIVDAPNSNQASVQGTGKVTYALKLDFRPHAIARKCDIC